MSFLKKLFGTAPQENDEERTRRNRFDTLKYDGIRALQMHEFALATRYLDQALVLCPDDMETCSYLAEAHMQTGETEQALPLLQRLAAHEPQNTNILLALAQAAVRLKNWEEAAEACRKALEADDKLAAAYYVKGEAAHRQGNEIEAVAYLTQALQLDDTCDAARQLRAEVLCVMRQFTEAREDADALLTRHPDEENVWLLKGNIEAGAGQLKEAARAFARTCELNPFNHEALLKEGECLVADGQAEKALERYNDAIATEPDFAEAYKARGNVRMLTGDKQGALEDLKKALELKPSAIGAIADGEYSNMENRMEDMYRRLNPYGF